MPNLFIYIDRFLLPTSLFFNSFQVPLHHFDHPDYVHQWLGTVQCTYSLYSFSPLIIIYSCWLLRLNLISLSSLIRIFHRGNVCSTNHNLSYYYTLNLNFSWKLKSAIRFFSLSLSFFILWKAMVPGWPMAILPSDAHGCINYWQKRATKNCCFFL